MKTPPQPPPCPPKPLVSPSNSPAALTAATHHLGKSKLPYISPFVVQLNTAPCTSGRKSAVFPGEGMTHNSKNYSAS
ncbi:hypothetical protein MCEGE14_02459 [Burkholderiaceae bacterium]